MVHRGAAVAAALHGLAAINRGAVHRTAAAVVVMMVTTMATMAAAIAQTAEQAATVAAATATTTIITTATTIAAVTGHSTVVGAQQGDADHREEDRDAKNQSSIHLGSSKNFLVPTRVRNSKQSPPLAPQDAARQRRRASRSYALSRHGRSHFPLPTALFSQLLPVAEDKCDRTV
jgi:hypothetical protein